MQTPMLRTGIVADARGVTSRVATKAPSLAWIVDPRLSFGIAANATRFQAEQWSVGASGTTKPMRATPSPDGTWYVDLKLAPGRYRYAFRVDGTTWPVSDGAAAVDDAFGGKSAWLTIGGPDAAGIHDTTEE